MVQDVKKPTFYGGLLHFILPVNAGPSLIFPLYP